MNVKMLLLIAMFAQALSVCAQGTPPQVPAGSTAGTQSRLILRLGCPASGVPHVCRPTRTRTQRLGRSDRK
jgi:hypothetical protein